MKKINYEIVGHFENGSKYGVISKKTVEGQQIDEYAAVRKNDWKTCPWTVDSFKTGIAIISTGCRTRKEAIEKYEELKEAVVKILEDEDKMKKMLEQKAKAIPETELAQYEELDVATTYDHRLDTITRTAGNCKCIVKDVTEESYLHGGHIKVYGTAAMLAEVKKVIEKYEKLDADYAAAAKKAAEKQEDENMNKEVKQEEKQIQATTEPETEATTATPAADEIDISALTADNLSDYLPALLMSLANDKHNSSIILAAGIEAGAINPIALLEYFQTGRMPAVHTFDVWQKAGYQVRKGETAAFTARIWKHVEKTVKLTAPDAETMNAAGIDLSGTEYHEGDTIQRGEFIKKNAYFFTAEQVTKNAALPDLPEDVKKESRGGCCWISGNTYAIKDALKAAGFRWSKKNSAWYRREAA